MQLEQLIALSEKTRAAAAAACVVARARVEEARIVRRNAGEQRARLAPQRRRRRRRVVVFFADPERLRQMCGALAGIDCEIFATTQLATAVREIASDRPIDMLITEHGVAGEPKAAVLH